MMFTGGTLKSATGPYGDTPDFARLRYLFDDLILADSLTVGRPPDTDAWFRTLVDGGEFPSQMRTTMLRLAAEWSNRNRTAIRCGWIARLRPTERFFWKDFNRGKLRKDWAWVLRTDFCVSAVRLWFDTTRRGRSFPGRIPTATTGSFGDLTRGWRRQQLKRRLERYEVRATRRALEPDSHLQISYNLACLYSVRSVLSKSPDAAMAWRRLALQWLERCQDRRASDQLVQEWVRVDGDLEPLRRRDIDPNTAIEFGAWASRLRKDHEGASPRARGRKGLASLGHPRVRSTVR